MPASGVRAGAISPARAAPLMPPVSTDYDFSAVPTRGIVKSETTDDEWKRRRRAPTSGTRVRFDIPENANNDLAPQSAMEAMLEPVSAPPLHLTADERRLLGEDVAEGADAAGAEPAEDSHSTDSFNMEAAKADDANSTLARSHNLNPITLTFVDPALERKYVDFFTQHQGFAAGKLYAGLAGVIATGLLFPYLSFTFTAERWSQVSVIILFCGVSVGWLMLGTMFLKVALKFREIAFFIALATHWPAFATATLLAKEDQAYRYAYTTLCFFLCCFLAQPRFVGMFFLLTITPVATCSFATFGSSGYWDSHSKFEMLYWVMPLFPLFMLRVFERRSREAFVENERGNAAIEVLAHRETLTRRIISSFFPLTASRRLLKTCGTESNAVYPGTAMVLSNVTGFTEWAAQTSAEMVVSRVASMFMTMERLGQHYGVEKVTTLGDMYFGAIFPVHACATRTLALGTVDDEVNRRTSAVDPRGGSSSEHRRSVNSRMLHQATHQTQHGGPLGTSTDAIVLRPDAPAIFTHGAGTSSGSVSSSTAAVDAALYHNEVAQRCHRVLRFATAIRHHKRIMSLRIGVHVGSVIGGFVGIQPPKFDLFGTAVERVKHLEERGRHRRVHASQEIVDAAAELGHPSDDFEASDSDALIFSSWWTIMDGSAGANPPGTTAPLSEGSGNEPMFTSLMSGEASLSGTRRTKNPLRTAHSRPPSNSEAPGAEGGTRDDDVRRESIANALHLTSKASRRAQKRRGEGHTIDVEMDRSTSISRRAIGAAASSSQENTSSGSSRRSESKIDESVIQEKALVLCRFLTRFGESQRDAALENFDNREAVLRRSIARGMVQREPDLGDAHSPPQSASPVALGSTQSAAVAVSTSGAMDSADAENLSDGWDRASDRSDVGLNEPAQFELGDDEVLKIENPGEEKQLYKMEYRWMRFEDAQVEQQYQSKLINSNLGREVYGVFALMSIYVLFANIANACMIPWENRLVMMIAGVVMMLHLAYLEWIGTRHKYNIVAMLIPYTIIAWLAAMLYRAECSTPYDVTSGGNIIALFFTQLCTAPAFSLELPMPIRIGILVLNVGQFCIAVLIRRAAIRDTVLVWDGLWACFLAANAFLSFFADLANRSGHQATMRRRALQSNRSAHAERTAEALEMMMPSFVIDRLMRAARRVGGALPLLDFNETGSELSHHSGLTHLSSGTSGTTGSALSSGHVNHLVSSDMAHAMLVRRSETVWPYPRAVVMFVSFDPPVLAYDAISDTVTRIEAVARGRSIQKIKTIGTTALFVAGIDKTMQFEDAVVNSVEAALEIQRRVFPPLSKEAGWTFRIGLHCGPIFGAVIGSQGLSFDVYGDTVNTAAAMMNSAPANAVRCTLAVRQALPLADASLDFAIQRIGVPVNMKGKAPLAAYHVLDSDRKAMHTSLRGGDDASPAELLATSMISQDGGAGGQQSNPPATRGGGGRQGIVVDDPDSDDENRPAPSVIAESIRSSLRTAAMLPSAAGAFRQLHETDFSPMQHHNGFASPASLRSEEDALASTAASDAPVAVVTAATARGRDGPLVSPSRPVRATSLRGSPNNSLGHCDPAAGAVPHSGDCPMMGNEADALLGSNAAAADAYRRRAMDSTSSSTTSAEHRVYSSRAANGVVFDADIAGFTDEDDD